MKELLILFGIIFPILFFIKNKELKKLKIDFFNIKTEFENYKKNIKEEVYQKALEYTAVTITSEFDYEKKKNKNNSHFRIEDKEYYDLKKISKEFLYPIKGLEDTGNYFFGKKVVITGDFNNFSSRNEMAKLLWEAGADVDIACGKYTECLIAGENASYNKKEIAEDLGADIFNEEKFLEEFNL